MAENSERTSITSISLFATRLPVWALAICIGAWIVGSANVEFSRQVVERGWDKSAMAWTGFLPFAVPLFLVESAKVVLPVAFIYELLAMLHSRGESRNESG